MTGIDGALHRARGLVRRGQGEAAKQVYLEALALDRTCFAALNELATLAYETGHRAAARTAYSQAVTCHPANPVGRVNLGNLLFAEGELAAARQQYEAALALDAGCHQAHQGLSRVLRELGDPAADLHRRRGFTGHALVPPRPRDGAPRLPVLMLVCEQDGNMPTRLWLDESRFAVTTLYAEFDDPASPLPPHVLLLNAIGDADLCGPALARAEAVLARSVRPVINAPARVLATARASNARRLAALPGVTAPRIEAWPRAAPPPAADLHYPLLLRAPGYHVGRHFVRVDSPDALGPALAALPGETILAIEYLDARGADGLARKYRVMFVDGVAYPLHLAIAADWKVHYFSAAMAESAAHREEEQRFLDDMPGALGGRSLAALAAIGAALGLDYAGVDFACGRDGSLLLFEANAAMAVIPPDPDPIWDYRRRAAEAVLAAARRMLARRAEGVPGMPGLKRGGRDVASPFRGPTIL